MYQWAVIGAGPAGIATIGKLIDFGIAKKDIAWIDPKFSVGDFGTIWCNVPSNTRVHLFLKFLHASPAFDYKNCYKNIEINNIHPDKTCPLHYMAEPLQWITNHLKQTINVIEDVAISLNFENKIWNIACKNNVIESKNVILAIGAEPKKLFYPNTSIIPLQDAMDKKRIHTHLTRDDTVAVFGSSHSAILIIKNLIEHEVKQIINFYRSPLRYAIPYQDWILYDDTGLKGSTALWAREHIDKQLPKNLLRVYSENSEIEKLLPLCTKVCYAIGFEKRSISILPSSINSNYNAENGVIAPGLFGVGIAFPEAKYNPLGLLEYRVGLWKFMEYLQYIMPVWFKY